MSAEPVEPVAFAEQSGSPFLQLDFYRQADQARFAGRDDEINAVVTGILSFDTFVVYGRSGLGKTSLLLAGVFPQLQQRGVTPIYTRVLDLPVAELQKKIEAEIAAVPGSVILILDQFEEFFIRVREQNEDHPSRRMSACREMSAMLQDMRRRFGGRVRLLFGIREDYYAELEDFRAEFPNIAAHGFRLLPLTAYGARRAIILMLERAHPPVIYEPNLVNLLLDEIARTGFDPLLLQIICGEVWREATAKREGTNELREEDLRSVGGFEEIFQRYVKRAAEAAPDPLLVRVVLDTLITAEQTKRVVRASDLLRDGASTRIYVRASKEEVDALLAQLVELQLVRPLGESRERYELLHDRLVPVVRKWLESDKTFVDFRFAKKFIDSMASDGQFRTNLGRLISNAQMEQIVNRYAERLQLTPDETELLFRSSIHAGVRDWTVFWASRLDEAGEERSARTMDEMLTNMDFRLRLVAAKAVWALKSGHTFVPRLLQMAMEDRADIREAAARSFATLATDDDLAMVVPYFDKRRMRERATAIVVECYDQLRNVKLFPWQIRVRAWMAVRKRSAAADGERIRGAMASGALRGGIFGMLWALIVAFALQRVVIWNTEPSMVILGDPSRVTVATVLAMLGAAAGVAIGYLSARREARRDAVAKWETWYGGPMRGVVQNVIVYILAVFAWNGLSIDASSSDVDTDTFRLPLLIALSLPGLALALFVPLGQRLKRDPARVDWLRLHRVWPWLALSILTLSMIASWKTIESEISLDLVACMFVPIFSTAAGSALLRLRRWTLTDNEWLNGFWTLAVTSGPGALATMLILWSYETAADSKHVAAAAVAAFSCLFGCYRASVVGPALDRVIKHAEVPRLWRVSARASAIATLLVSAVWYLALFGYRSVPWLDRPVSQSERTLEGRLLRAVPNVHYFRFNASAEEPAIIETWSRYAQGNDGYFDQLSPRSIRFAPRPFTLPATPSDASPAGEYRGLVRFHPCRDMKTADGTEIAVTGFHRVPNGMWMADRALSFRGLLMWDRDANEAYAVSVEGDDLRLARHRDHRAALELDGSFRSDHPVHLRYGMNLQPKGTHLLIIGIVGHDDAGANGRE